MEIKRVSETEVIVRSNKPIYAFNGAGMMVTLAHQPVEDVKIKFGKKPEKEKSNFRCLECHTTLEKKEGNWYCPTCDEEINHFECDKCGGMWEGEPSGKECICPTCAEGS
jgi:rubrerythrin